MIWAKDTGFYSILFLPSIICVGFITIWTDWHKRSIENVFILRGLLYALMVYCLFWIALQIPFVHELWQDGIELSATAIFWYFDRWCINLFVSAVVAYGLWRNAMWGAGDAKLFICYAALVPMGQYTHVYFDYYFASFALLLWAFIAASTFLFIRFLFFTPIWKLVLILRTFWYSGIEDIKHFQAWGSCTRTFLSLVLFFTGMYIFYGVARTGKWAAYYHTSLFTVITFVVFGRIRILLTRHVGMTMLATVLLTGYIAWEVRRFGWAQFYGLPNALLVSFGMLIGFFLLNRMVRFCSAQVKEEISVPFAHWMLLGTLIVWFF